MKNYHLNEVKIFYYFFVKIKFSTKMPQGFLERPKTEVESESNQNFAIPEMESIIMKITTLQSIGQPLKSKQQPLIPC